VERNFSFFSHGKEGSLLLKTGEYRQSWEGRKGKIEGCCQTYSPEFFQGGEVMKVKIIEKGADAKDITAPD
jgi:hypothetical protein